MTGPVQAARTIADVRGWLPRLRAAWGRSLQFRTVALTVLLSTIAVGGTGAYLAITIAEDQYRSRVDESLLDAQRALAEAQSLFDASNADDRSELQAVMATARNRIAQVASSQIIAGYRAPGQEGNLVIPLDFQSAGIADDTISADLRATVQSGPAGQWWQATTLAAGDEAAPGIVAGSMLTLTDGSRFEIYIGYDFEETERTLQFMQRTMLVGGAALLLLVGAIAWLVVRLVASPVRVVAETSERLAAGDLEVRIPERGEDELATLARSFNGMADSLQRQIGELAELSRVQQRFVSDVSHELRTPLTTIRLAGDVFYDQRHSFTPSTRRTAELLHTQTERFELLLSDLLEISRYDARAIELDREPVGLVQIAEETIASMATLADSVGSDVRLVAPGGYAEITADGRRLRRIVRNLLGNAIEHGEGRPIVVSVDSSADAVALAVRDYGQGIAEADLARVFDRFWRADPARTRTIGGTGLGLAISLSDAQMHGGRLEAWSRPGAGAYFRLVLPRHQGGGPVRSPLPIPPDDADGPVPPAAGAPPEEEDE